MVILGLGSNVGDRLDNLRQSLNAINALAEIDVKQVSPVYISDALLPENAPPDWDMPYLNAAVRCHTPLEPLDLIKKLKDIEWTIGRKPDAKHWGPRIIDIDILAWDDRVIKSDELIIPHENLQSRPFALWPLADVAPYWQFPLPGPNQGKTAAEISEQWGLRQSGQAPLNTRQIFQRIDTPELVGIINVTPDSFSDGGHYLNSESAFQQAIQLIQSGASVLDIGAESTAPNAKPLMPDEEWARLFPVLKTIYAAKHQFILPPKISIDTRHAEIAERALAFDIDWINDVTGLEDPRMREIVSQTKKDCVVMHHISIPASKHHVLPRTENPIEFIYQWTQRKLDTLLAGGIAKEKIILDPGIGFGKTPEQSFTLIKQVERLAELDCRILIGHSRKSFLNWFIECPPQERDVETLALTFYLAKQPIHYLRVHNVEMNARALRIAGALS